MKSRTSWRPVLAIAAIAAGWWLVYAYGVLFLVFGDCFESGCREGRGGQANLFISFVIVGFVLSIFAYVRSRSRRLKGD